MRGTEGGGCGESPVHPASSERVGLTFHVTIYQTREALPAGRHVPSSVQVSKGFS